MAFSLALLIPSSIAFLTILQSLASLTFVAEDLSYLNISRASGKSLSETLNSAPTSCLRVNKTHK